MNDVPSKFLLAALLIAPAVEAQVVIDFVPASAMNCATTCMGCASPRGLGGA